MEALTSGHGVLRSVNRVFVVDVDERYLIFRTRGLNTTQRPESLLTLRIVIRSYSRLSIEKRGLVAPIS